MLKAIGLEAETDCYFGYCAPWCPPGGADPTELHLDITMAFVRRQIELATADHLLLLGTLPAQRLLGIKHSIMQARGRAAHVEGFGRTLTAIGTYPPVHLMREPALKRMAWHDLLILQDLLTASV